MLHPDDARRIGFGLVGIISGCAIGTIVGLATSSPLDKRLIEALEPARDGVSGELLRAATHVGSLWGLVVLGIVAALAAAVLRKGQHASRAAAYLLVTSPLAMLLTLLLKRVFGRERPALDPALHATGLSMPSGHATGSAALAAAVVLTLGTTRRRRRWLTAAGVVFALVVGISRPVLGVHWPSDVLAGWLVGTGVALALLPIFVPTQDAPAR